MTQTADPPGGRDPVSSETDSTTHPLSRLLAVSGLSRKTVLPPCVVDLDYLRRLYDDLLPAVVQSLEMYLDGLEVPADKSEEEFSEQKEKALRDAGTLSVGAVGNKGEVVMATSGDDLDEERLPKSIAAIAFDSGYAFRQIHNQELPNRFNLRFDFTRPPGFRILSYDPAKERTPNFSSLEILGPNKNWVNGIHETVMASLRGRKRNLAWLHSPTTYLVTTWLVGIPASFWFVYRLDSWASSFLGLPTVLRVGVYLYGFVSALLLYRLTFEAVRWLFPLIELKGSTTWKARAAVGGFALAVLASLLASVGLTVLR